MIKAAISDRNQTRDNLFVYFQGKNHKKKFRKWPISCLWTGLTKLLAGHFTITFKGAPIAKHFVSYKYFSIRHGSKSSPAKFQSDDVIMGSTGVK